MLNEESCYQALLTHDRRFDGVFYVAVTSTGVYCRTVCTARTPLRANCKFFRSAAAAECAGFRPCLRCRPELAPGNARIDSTSKLASAALNRIESGQWTGLKELSESSLGVSERHLRRVVQAEFGVSPMELAQTHRLLFAKLLLRDTRLPVTEIAFASGFESVRQFNGTFKQRYGMPPSEIRKNASKASVLRPLRCELAYMKPLPWSQLMQYLQWRAIPGVELVQDQSYARTLRIDECAGWLRAYPSERETIVVEVSQSLALVLPAVLARVKNLFDLQADTALIEERLGNIIKHSGLRVPGSCDAFELCLFSILGQQVSIRAAVTLLGRIVDKFGESIETPFNSLNKVTPTSAAFRDIAPAELKDLGITSAKVRTMLELSCGIESGAIPLPGHSSHSAKLIDDLLTVPGIGSWTAQYIAMRAAKWPDAFPHSDLGLKKALNEPNPNNILKLSEQWRPWRAYAAMHLWFSLMEKEESECILQR